MAIQKKTQEWHGVTSEIFLNEIEPLSQPAILRGFVMDWPLVKMAMVSDENASQYIKGFDTGGLCETMLGSPEIGGKLFYSEDMRGFNFDIIRESIRDALSRIINELDNETPSAILSGSIPVDEYLPKLSETLTNPISTVKARPKIWLGNAITVQTHYDTSSNIACVAAGQRRFTLFPPEQISNLYPGPMEFTPAGQPISMVRLDTPDFSKYPKFKDALAVAEVAVLEPGDAIYIPQLWWHQVQSIERFNILVNFWWNNLQMVPDVANTCFTHAMMSIRGLPEADRKAWSALFDHYIFQTNGNPVEHLAPENRGVLGDLTPERYESIKNHFLRCFQENQE